MTRSSSGVGSVLPPSADPEEPVPEEEGWRRDHVEAGDSLGEGGWGIVRRVRHRPSGDLRALKEPLREEDEVLARFKREIEVQSKVKHRHVMPVLQHGPEFDWFTMPLAERTLSKAAAEMGHDDVAMMLVHVCRGLQAAHDHGYVHRDIKPSNILERVIDPDRSDWVIGDFGVVRRPDGETTNLKTRHALGTHGYMAPEVALGEHGTVTALADIYSLGRTIAWATTGVQPERLAPLEARWPWKELVAHMTEFEPGKRPKDMVAIVESVATVMKTLRAQRAHNWGKPVLTALSGNEEALLALVFDEARDPEDAKGEISVSVEQLGRRWSTKASLRILLRRLVELGYLKEAVRYGENEPVRCYSPSQPAWNWATKNEARIASMLKSPPASDDDLPF